MPAANDAWADAIELDPTGDFSFVLVDAAAVAGTEQLTFQIGEPQPTANPTQTKTAWWKWTCPAAPMPVASARFRGYSNTHDCTLGVYTGASLAALVEIDSDDSGYNGDDGQVTIVDPVPGTTYYLQVGITNATGYNYLLLSALNTWGAPPGSPEFAVEIYDGNNAYNHGLAYLGTMSEDFGRNVLDVKNEVGSWRLSVLRDSDDAVDLVANNIVKFRLDGDIVFAGRIEPWEQQTLAPGEEVDEVLSLAHAGLLDTIRDAEVYQHPDCALVHDTRTFNFASLDYTDWLSSPWIDAYELFQQGDAVDSLYGVLIPQDWPDPSAWWMWGTPEDLGDDPLMAVGDNYFLTEVDLDTGDYALFIAVDDGYELWVDGVVVAAQTQAFMFRQTHRVDLFLVDGLHRIGIRATNIDRPVSSTNFAAVLFSMYSTTNGGELDLLVLHSDSTWRALAYPATPPGFTPGEIMEILIFEAWNRGAFWLWSYDFTTEVDSLGEAWTAEIDLACKIGESYLDVLRKIAETSVDLGVLYDSINLRMMNKGGLDTGAAVDFDVAVDFVSLKHAGRPELATSALVHESDGTFVEINSGVPVEDGLEPRREVMLEAGSAPSSAAADRMAAGLFDEFVTPRVNVTFEVVPTSSKRPWSHYWPGKTVTMPDRYLDDAPTELRTLQIADRAPSDEGELEGTVVVTGEGLQDAT